MTVKCRESREDGPVSLDGPLPTTTDKFHSVVSPFLVFTHTPSSWCWARSGLWSPYPVVVATVALDSFTDMGKLDLDSLPHVVT